MPAAFLSLLIALALTLSASAEWPGVPWTEVRAYAWPLEQNESAVVLPGLKLRRGTLRHSGAALSPGQCARLLKAELRRVSPRPAAACYVPHNAFVFYNSAHQPVAFLELCFDCLGARTFPADAECDPDFIALAQICSELKLPFGRFKTFAEFRAVTDPILAP